MTLMNYTNLLSYIAIGMIPQEAWDRGVTFICLFALASYTFFRDKKRDAKECDTINRISKLYEEQVDSIQKENERLHQEIRDLRK